MASYNVTIAKSAAKDIERVPLKDRRRIVARIRALGEDPRPPGHEKLSGDEKYRVRQGDYRILYEIVDADLVVSVVRVGNRQQLHHNGGLARGPR